MCHRDEHERRCEGQERRRPHEGLEWDPGKVLAPAFSPRTSGLPFLLVYLLSHSLDQNLSISSPAHRVAWGHCTTRMPPCSLKPSLGSLTFSPNSTFQEGQVSHHGVVMPPPAPPSLQLPTPRSGQKHCLRWLCAL